VVPLGVGRTGEIAGGRLQRRQGQLVVEGRRPQARTLPLASCGRAGVRAASRTTRRQRTDLGGVRVASIGVLLTIDVRERWSCGNCASARSDLCGDLAVVIADLPPPRGSRM
jgi:hypothetical protein